MKLLVATALFPPDIADPAPYIKELATRLGSSHDVTVLTYGAIPEAIANVNIVVIPKHQPALIRLISFTRTLIQLTHAADRVLIENAPATELPALMVGLLYRKKMILHMSDAKIVYTGWRKFIHDLAVSTVTNTISIPLPLPRPEIHPFKPLPANAHSEYEQSWCDHLDSITTHLT